MPLNTKTKTKTRARATPKTVKKTTAVKADVKPPVAVVPAVVPAEPEVEWVTLPKAGDCIALRIDNEATIGHLPTMAEVEYLQRQPTETRRYLAIVTGVLTAPTKGRPWCTCIMHLLPPPPTQGGTVHDFQPRTCTVVRLRPRKTQRAPMFAFGPGLLDALFKEAAWVAARVDTRPLNWTSELHPHWATTQWIVPEHPQRSAHRTTVLPPHAVLYEPEMDSHHVADFDYSWAGAFGSPQAHSYESVLICSKIFLTRAIKILAVSIPDQRQRAEEVSKVHRSTIERTSAIASAPVWATITHTVNGLTTVHRSGQPPMSPYARNRAMCMP